MSKPLVSLRTFLKSTISALAILPVFGFSKPRKFITRVHRDDIIGLHIIGTHGEDWVVTEQAGPQFNFYGKLIRRWSNLYWEIDLKNPIHKQLSCFNLDADGYSTLSKDTKAWHP